MLKLICCSITLFVSLIAGALTAAAERPNIILLMGDDHGWDETGYNGHPHLHTPVLDQMAATGLRLDHFYSAHPTCSPTRGSVMTGRHPNRYGTFTPNCSIRPEEIGIAEILGKAGYACGHFGKWHLGPVKASSPTNPGAFGFDHWLSHDNFFELDPVLSRNGAAPEKIEGESSEIIIDEAIRFMQSAQNSDAPFFTVVWFGSPHEPYSGLEKDLALYDDLPESYTEKTFRLTSNETGKPTKRPLNEVLRERYAEITAMDRSIGQLRNWLASKGLSNNTILWYCGDNGTPGDGIITSPFRGQKGNVYEGGIRVPGLIEWPAKIKKSQVSDVNAVTTDTLPTLCDLLELELPDRPIDGISLMPVIDGEMTKRSEPICFWSFAGNSKGSGKPYIEAKLQQGTTPLTKMMAGRFTRNFVNYHHPEITDGDYSGARAILDNQYKLVVKGGANKADAKTELFDLSSDPAESKDIAAEHPELADSLSRKLRDWQQSVLSSLTGEDYQ